MADLREMLMKLASIGQPRLAKMDDGCWHCGIDFPAPEGVTAEVSSGFKHQTPEEALQCVFDRLGGLQSMLSVPSPLIGATHVEINQ